MGSACGWRGSCLTLSRDHRSRAGQMLQVVYRVIDVAVVALILTALT
jgi:hypothetical protein